MSADLMASRGARDELAKLSSLVLTARRLLGSGALVELSALEQRVRALCDQLQQMPRDQGRDLLDDLQALIFRLDQLAEDLKTKLRQLPSLSDGNG